MKVAAVVPAYNEADRLPRVLQIFTQTDCVHEIIVANDGSTDRTAAAAAQFPHVRVINLPRNKGKGGAMFAGATATDADVIVFFDADLIGLQPEHVSALVEPIVNDGYAMAIGVFRGGRWSTDMAQILAPNISGQRALRREIFLEVPGIEAARSGVEIALTLHVKRRRYPVKHVVLEGHHTYDEGRKVREMAGHLCSMEDVPRDFQGVCPLFSSGAVQFQTAAKKTGVGLNQLWIEVGVRGCYPRNLYSSE